MNPRVRRLYISGRPTKALLIMREIAAAGPHGLPHPYS